MQPGTSTPDGAHLFGILHHLSCTPRLLPAYTFKPRYSSVLTRCRQWQSTAPKADQPHLENPKFGDSDDLAELLSSSRAAAFCEVKEYTDLEFLCSLSAFSNHSSFCPHDMSGIPEPIAIIGSACRLPGDCNGPSELWNLLKNPRDLRASIPESRFSRDGFYQEDGQYHGHSNVRHAYMLAGEQTHRQFDARFFGISPSEANLLDPQIRLLLETVFEALEDAGQTIEGLQGSDTAIYAGTMLSEYERLMLRDEDSLGTYHGTGTARALVSNRVSYYFDWRGPSMTIDTACSSSLIAVYLAVQQLRTGQSRVAVAAGANLLLDPQSFISFSKLRMLSPDGYSRMWDAEANGYARGEGTVAIIMKTLSAAQEDGDIIDCIIREVGTNQDGRTPGLTVPSASAQSDLIRACYARAGLDLKDENDCPQYVEAHGTGTPVGDPIEAEAIYSTFLAGKCHDPLYVGSIKSVIGHTEGTAGLAALLKGSLAVQNAVIPPNLHFNRLNPKIEPFYVNLKVPTTSLPWPSDRHVRRASINCFGFGGSNAHAILENYTNPNESRSSNGNFGVFAPFVFSAASQSSLTSYLTSFCNYLRGPVLPTPRDLTYTLYERRSRFQFSTSISASNNEDLLTKLRAKLNLVKSNKDQDIGIRSLSQNSEVKKPRLLGIFTGQGAQWAGMGAELVTESVSARRIFKSLDLRLSQLPLDERPSWSLLDEIQKDKVSSRIGQASFSQPLCTALQILQVDMLHAAGVHFSAVVGHSSGEIGAAYASGFITAEDAICIAYYRGLYAELAKGDDGESGLMMAIESSVEDIQELCGSRHFRGKLNIAAINSPTSLTISGDGDAVQRLQVILQDENKFARLLKVDKAYHSHHMLACSEKYLDALLRLKVRVLPGNGCDWFSSVYETSARITAQDELSSSYWESNLTKPVLFMQALQSAWSAAGLFDLAVEVGPHPALKSPVLASVQQSSADGIPYSGMLQHGKDAVEAFADGLGFVWSHLGSDCVDFKTYEVFMSGTSASAFKLLKGLPSYAWDHDGEYWHESRYTRAQRLRKDSVHPLLGHITPDSSEVETRWRNLLRPKELPWTRDHRLQGQIVFPAAAYVVMVLEAALQLCKNAPVHLIELLHLEFDKALAFDHDDTSIEAIFSFINITRHDEQKISANFTYSAAESNSDELSLIVSGSVKILLGKISLNALPARCSRPPSLFEVDASTFYESLEHTGYHYSGSFKALTNIERKLGFATGSILRETTDMLIHPGELDAAFQSIFLAHSMPFDGGIWTLHVPKAIRSIRVNPSLCVSKQSRGKSLIFDSFRSVESSNFVGDINIYSESSLHTFIQVQELNCVPLAASNVENDKEIFSVAIWDVANPDARALAYDFSTVLDERNLSHLLERVAMFYLRRLERSVPILHPSRSRGDFSNLFKFASHCITLAESGVWSWWKSGWNNDTYEHITAACQPYAGAVEIKLLRAIGDDLIEITTDDKQAIEVGMQDNLLADYYQRAIGMKTYSRFLGRIAKQIVHRYPHLNILEIGAGTGGATKTIFEEIGQSYTSYTFTDISSGFFVTARDVFNGQHGMSFTVLDINKDPHIQGFKIQSYDLVVASMVLHATESLEATLHNVRRLIKPGGYLVFMEGIPDANIHGGTIFGAFPGWWAGSCDERNLTPFIDAASWDKLLRKTGFSGCDSIAPNPEPLIAPMTVFVTQATDDRIVLLRDPLSSTPRLLMDRLVIVGGTAAGTSRLPTEIKGLLSPYFRTIETVPSVTATLALQVSNLTSVLSLNDLDEPFFKCLHKVSWNAFKRILMSTRNILWVTHSRRSTSAYANMIAGLLRTAKREMPTLNSQLLDFADKCEVRPSIIAETLVRLMIVDQWRLEGTCENFLTSVEPEIILDSEYQAFVPRMIASREMNERYNSSRRPISTNINVGGQILSMRPQDSGHVLLRQPSGTSVTTIGLQRVTHSSLSAIKIAESSHMFLMLGQDFESGCQSIIISTTLDSVASPWDAVQIETKVKPGFEIKFLSQVCHEMLASTVLAGIREGDQILVLEGSPALVSSIACRARNLGIGVMMITYDMTCNEPNWLKIHRNASDRDVQMVLPKNISLFVDLRTPEEFDTGGHPILSNLSALCRRESTETLFLRNSCLPRDSDVGKVKSHVRDVVNNVFRSLSIPGVTSFKPSSVGISALSELKVKLVPHTIVDWTLDKVVAVRVQPSDSQLMFSESKTYWLAGLTHSLGLSLCEWMIRHGAKYIVLSSREPYIDESWLSMMSATDAVVKVLSCDITISEEVKKVYAEICTSMPPVGGVAQGAMVLHDTSISDMTIDQLLAVTSPKVKGSSHLNELFQENTLDFFIFFSSTSAVLGNPGQGNYSAANFFMSSLAEERHRQGLAASIINIGPVLGVGYITQQNIDLRRGITNGEAMFISETDFHQLFAEAVIAGQPGGSGPIELTSGLAKISSQDKVQPTWASNPIMSHYIKDDDGSEPIQSAGVKVPIRTQLSQARSKAEVSKIVTNAFLSRLSILYQLPVEDLINTKPSDLRLSELGTDSLLATEIRAWFLKTLQVNIPVLKILGGATVYELLTVANEAISPSWIPGVTIEERIPVVTAPPAAVAKIKELHDDPSSNDEYGSSTVDMLVDDIGKFESQPSSLYPESEPCEERDDIQIDESADAHYQRQGKLSFNQAMFWFVLQFSSDKSSLNHTGSFRLRGKLIQQDFEYALRSIGQQHEILRTCFFEDQGQPMQGVREICKLRGEYRHINYEKEVAQVVKEMESYEFDIANGETLRVVLLSISPTIHFLVMSSHSLVMDGQSFQIFLEDLQRHYTRGPQQSEVPQYLDHTLKQYRDYDSGDYHKELRFWKAEFVDFPDPLPVLTQGKVLTRPALTTYGNERADIRFGIETKRTIQAVCRRYGVTPFHFHLTVFRVLLARYSDIDDISIGTCDANRSDENTMGIGPFANLVPLRFQTKTGAKFEMLLRETCSKTLATLANSQIPFQVLLNELDAPRSAASTPIFQCFVDYRLGHREKTTWADCELEMLSFQVSKLAYDVALDVIDDPVGDCIVMLIVRKDLYSQHDAESLLKSYERLVNAFLKQSDVVVDIPKIFDSRAVGRAIAFGQGPVRERQWPETIIHEIDEVVERRLTEPAVKWDDQYTATYSEIRARANKIARALLDAKVTSGMCVAVLQEPTADWIASIIAVMRIGAIYLPLDQGLPWSRLSFMMSDCQSAIMIVDKDTVKFVEQLHVPKLQAINVSELSADEAPPIPVTATSSTTATILYTSGSTGTPKGIVLKHEGLRNWLESTANVYGLESETVLQQSSPGFDMSLIQVFTALCLGGTLYLVPRTLRGDALAISELIHSKAITYTFTCTSELVTWFKYGNRQLLSQSAWRRAITGGEPGVEVLFKQFASLVKPDLRLFHAYGPTEITWTATSMELLYDTLKDAETYKNTAVGYTLPNYSVYILDKHSHPVPPGVQGEIYIGGPGVATCYLNNSTLTTQKFVPDIFMTLEQPSSGRNSLHRTGDLGRWGETGELFIEGRTSEDTQIKLRGLRINLMEIERALIEASRGAVSEAVVSARRSTPEGPQFLVAHVVFDQKYPHDERPELLATLNTHLELPRYMCPSTIISLDDMPLTKSHKLDRRAIAALPLTGSAEKQYLELTKTELRLKILWESVVSESLAAHYDIEPSTDFFHIGGTSLLLLDLRRRIQHNFHVTLSLTDMFSASTLASMALVIEDRDQARILSTHINWSHETDLTPRLEEPSAPSSVNNSLIETVVLTGSTGYLGKGILKALIQDPDVKRIHCIAVRDARSRQDLLHSEKITYYEGDLILPHLGLSNDEIEKIFDAANAIIHNGADVSYLKTYASLRLSNVQATKTLAELCLRRNVAFHYISSGGACSFAAARGIGDIVPRSVSRYPPPTSGEMGYTSSKWASEGFIEKLKAQHSNWPICIHRPSNISRIDAPQLDLVYNVQQYSRLLSAVPVLRGKAQGVLNCVSLSAVVHGIWDTVKETPLEVTDGSVRFVHHLGSTGLPMNDIRFWISGSDNDAAPAVETTEESEIEEISIDQWTNRAAEQGMHPSVVAFFQTLREARYEKKFPNLVNDVEVLGSAI